VVPIPVSVEMKHLDCAKSRLSNDLGFKESLQHPPDEEALHAVTEA
jgi:hypothetical protein